jgi:replicative DNA helicase
MFIEMRPAGIDMLDPRDVAWLDRAISSVGPDLLVLGPLYKLHHADMNKEEPARELVWQLDLLRERHGFALLTEAHAGNAEDRSGNRQMRPVGSSVFRRWSEFGFGLVRARTDPGHARAEIVDVISWRGSREERAWPTQLQHGTTLPWMPADPAYYDQLPRSV